MKIKISEKEHKAIVRFKHPMEVEWFKRTMAGIRDSDPKMHPPIVLKDEKGNVRILPPPKSMVPKSDEHMMVNKGSSVQSMPPPQKMNMNPIVVKKDEIKKPD